jgi:apolipoprotein N-acyltransferase
MNKPFVRRMLLGVLTGLLYPLCFPSFDLGMLAWILLIPLHLAIVHSTPKDAWRIGWASGFIAFLGTMYWVVTVMHEFGKVPVVVSDLVLVLLAAYLGLYVALYAWALVKIRAVSPLTSLLAAPAVWIALEYARSYALSGFPWALLGYSQYLNLPVIQIADHTAVYGVSFLVVLVNVALTDWILWWQQRSSTPTPRPLPWQASAAAAVALVITLGYGMSRLNETTPGSQAGSPPRTLSIGLVQGNIDQSQKWDVAFRRETIDRYLRLTREAAKETDLIIWPEAATPFLFEREPEYQWEVMRLTKETGIPLLFGSPTLRYFPDGRPYLHNSAFLLDAQGDIAGRYDKQHLVPFGEYIPLKGLLFFLDKFVEGIGDFEPGLMSSVFPVPSTIRQETTTAFSTAHAPRFGVVICYEVIFPDLVREFSANGADFMVTITNDAWFGHSAAPYQHFGMVVFRAVENHVSFARSANTGISGFIDPQGRILLATPIFQELAVRGSIPVGSDPTFYTRYGDVFAVGCVILAGLCLGLALVQGRSRQSTTTRTPRAR